MYEIRYSNTAREYFKKIKEKGLKAAFRKALEKIEDNPYCVTMKSVDLAGIYCYDVFYNRTNYEIAYRIYEEDDKIIVVIMAGTRENFYNELKRYLN